MSQGSKISMSDDISKVQSDIPSSWDQIRAEVHQQLTQMRPETASGTPDVNSQNTLQRVLDLETKVCSLVLGNASGYRVNSTKPTRTQGRESSMGKKKYTDQNNSSPCNKTEAEGHRDLLNQICHRFVPLSCPLGCGGWFFHLGREDKSPTWPTQWTSVWNHQPHEQHPKQPVVQPAN